VARGRLAELAQDASDIPIDEAFDDSCAVWGEATDGYAPVKRSAFLPVAAMAVVELALNERAAGSPTIPHNGFVVVRPSRGVLDVQANIVEAVPDRVPLLSFPTLCSLAKSTCCGNRQIVQVSGAMSSSATFRFPLFQGSSKEAGGRHFILFRPGGSPFKEIRGPSAQRLRVGRSQGGLKLLASL